MKKTKDRIQKHPFIYALLALLHHRKDKDYLCLFSNIQKTVIIDSKSNNLNSAPICIFDATDKIGLFAYLRRVTEFLYYCDNMGFRAYIKWTNSDYIDHNIKHTDNPFEYFYKQPSLIEETKIDDGCLVRYAPGKLTMARSFISDNLYNPDKEFIIKMGAIQSKYLILQNNVAAIIDKFISTNAIDETTLGVHIRGTDFRKVYKHHPIFVEPRDYFPYIEKAMRENHFTRIFLATDDENILNEFLEHYSAIEVLYLKSTSRGNGVLGIHKAAAFNDDISQYGEAINALCDVYSLASCGGIISGLSHVSMFARIIKAGKKEAYSFDSIINKGVHKSGINATTEKFKEERVDEVK